MSILQNCLKAFSFVGAISILNIGIPAIAANFIQIDNDIISITELDDFRKTGNLDDLSPELHLYLKHFYALSKIDYTRHRDEGYELGFEYLVYDIRDQLLRSVEVDLPFAIDPVQWAAFLKSGDLHDLPEATYQQLRSVYAAHKYEELDSSGLIDKIQSQDFFDDIHEQLNRPIDIEPHLLDAEDINFRNLFLSVVRNMGISGQDFDTALDLMAENAQGDILIDFLKDFPVETITKDNFLQNLQSYMSPIAKSLDKILYLNSTRGHASNYGSFREPIADTLDDYKRNTVFDVDFIQTHIPGNLADWLNSKPLGYYDQIWFDTTVLSSPLLDSNDLLALNTWAENKQPEFILDSSFFARNRARYIHGKPVDYLTASSASATINQALALQEAGGGIFIGTDHNCCTNTANQILGNFGFDGFFTGSYNITSNASFVGDLFFDPEPVGSDFFTNHLAGLSTSSVPVGTHVLNENGGNRTIEIYEQLYSYSPGKVVHVGASFRTDLESVPEPGAVGGLALLGAIGLGKLVTRKRKGA